MNRVCLVGRLCKDIDLKYSQSGTAVAKVSIAVDGYKKDEVDFINLTMFGKTAEFAAQYTEKGCLVEVEGRIKNNNYEKDGKTVYRDDVIAEKFRPHTWKKKDEQGNDAAGSNFPF